MGSKANDSKAEEVEIRGELVDGRSREFPWGKCHLMSTLNNLKVVLNPKNGDLHIFCLLVECCASVKFSLLTVKLTE